RRAPRVGLGDASLLLELDEPRLLERGARVGVVERPLRLLFGDAPLLLDLDEPFALRRRARRRLVDRALRFLFGATPLRFDALQLRALRVRASPSVGDGALGLVLGALPFVVELVLVLVALELGTRPGWRSLPARAGIRVARSATACHGAVF